MNFKNKKIYLTALCLLILGVTMLEAKETINSPKAFLNILNSGAKEINKKRVRNFEIDDKEIIFKDKTFNKIDFYNLTLMNAVIKNVIFNNCSFKATAFYNVSLENVTFNNCSFEVEGNPNIEDNQAFFKTLKMENVTFNGGDFRNFFAKVRGEGGSVILKNIKVKGDIRDSPSIFFMGDNLSLRIDNCEFEYTDIYSGSGNYKSTLYATNSKFINANQAGNYFLKTVWYENCHFEGTTASLGITTVLKNSYLDNSFRAISEPTEETQRVYVSNCEMPKTFITGSAGKKYWAGTYFDVDKNNIEVYIYGSPQHKEMALALLDGGKYYIFDADITALNLRTYKDLIEANPDLNLEQYGPIELNLKNVTIKGGPAWVNDYPDIDWEGITITKGMWDNVKIYPIVNMKSARVENLLVHNLQFPEGVPWINANENTFAPYKERKVPLDIPKPPLPTLEEVGIVDPLK